MKLSKTQQAVVDKMRDGWELKTIGKTHLIHLDRGFQCINKSVSARTVNALISMGGNQTEMHRIPINQRNKMTLDGARYNYTNQQTAVFCMTSKEAIEKVVYIMSKLGFSIKEDYTSGAVRTLVFSK